ncbi:hypothetical protein COU97_00990 [Candidatus Shapirobacteria bacterium CG10_big_fil_rev_8_21_14_0_10_48_15]|uniref:LysM domain-containing protein n=1 Tax=Candidatus Shapirobacteria bacterium CG10_big_fil_rev_8_21_14_0_10_48_15 TaxID=1974484 RepID=A0A2M8L7I1_9BACT|nr:MAG: hypothetical protein COU97_00990 [Candidatus Shapirobacteria bacterium CG10_big_fil_rev_8_21_14_0_10_48_15]
MLRFDVALPALLPGKEEIMPQTALKGLLKKLKLNESTVSMFLGALVVIVIGTLVFNYFRGVGQENSSAAEEEAESETTAAVEEMPTLNELPKNYQVKLGDSLWKIAFEVYGSGYNWVEIAQANSLDNPNLLAVGQELTLPQVEEIRPFGKTISDASYTVEEGDNLWEIAVRAYGDGYRWPDLAEANSLVNPNLIHTGNTLTIPR